MQPVVRFRIASPPPTGQSAIALIDLTGDIDTWFTRAGVKPVPISAVLLRALGGVDHAVIARPSEHHALICPHAGPVIVRQVIAFLLATGAAAAEASAPAYPETTHEREAALHRALARAASPLAIDLLLDQPRRWREGLPAIPPPLADELQRLIDPALVLLLGPPNIGKSTLVNTLAGREVALVADEPGTTRDHIGVQIDFAGVVARVVDCPGLSPARGTADDTIQHAAQAAALALIPSAALILLCADPANPPPPLPPSADPSRILHLTLRADLGDRPADLSLSSHTRAGVRELVALVRTRLVSPEALAHPGSWIPGG